MNSELSPIQFIDLKAQRDRVRDAVESGWSRVVDHGIYIMGPEVKELEGQLAKFTGAKEVISCSSGTDAVWLPMLALGIGPGDAVFIPSWTFTATAEAVCLCGAVPVFVDVDAETFNMDPESLKTAIHDIKSEGHLTPKAIIPVDLFGLVAPYKEINAIATDEGLKVVSDAAQSFGASSNNERVGILTDITATSFFPAKPLGCWGDGGAIFTNDPEIAETLRSIRVHGRGGHGKYDNVRVGTNARLDTIQAVVLMEKLKIFEDELNRRRAVADCYRANLASVLSAPMPPAESTAAWAQYTIKVDHRDKVQAFLKEQNIPTQVYYPRPLHMQGPYKDFPIVSSGLPVTNALKDQVLSLPMHPYLESDVVERICSTINLALNQV